MFKLEFVEFIVELKSSQILVVQRPFPVEIFGASLIFKIVKLKDKGAGVTPSLAFIIEICCPTSVSLAVIFIIPVVEPIAKEGKAVSLL